MWLDFAKWSFDAFSSNRHEPVSIGGYDDCTAVVDSRNVQWSETVDSSRASGLEGEISFSITPDNGGLTSFTAYLSTRIQDATQEPDVMSVAKVVVEVEGTAYSVPNDSSHASLYEVLYEMMG